MNKSKENLPNTLKILHWNDWIIISPNMASKFINFKVDYEFSANSDHYPLIVNFKIGNKKNENNENSTQITTKETQAYINFDFSRADWDLYKKYLNETKFSAKEENIAILNSQITSSILNARNSSIPLKNAPISSYNNPKEIELPKYIMDMIKFRKKLKSQIRKTIFVNTLQLKQDFNAINKTIREEIKAFKSNKWELFLKQQGKNPISSSKFWRKIKFEKSNSSIPTLIYNNTTISTNEEKANTFACLLKDTFSETSNSNFNDKFKQKVEVEIKKKLDEPMNNFEIFTIEELNEAIKELNCKLTSGIDGVSNLLLKKLPLNFRLNLLHLFNQTIIQSKIPEPWKVSIITMIPKKQVNSKNPKDYRPISLTSCLAKLCERIIANRIKKILKQKKIIIKQQSGFRHQRQTKDNIFQIIQKTNESFIRKKKVLSIFFDISQAFDKVWHASLIKKLFDLKIPNYIIKWLYNYLSNRSFRVKVGEFTSISFKIETGVPQGAVLSPLLFSVYINDIPIVNKKNKSYSLLFADDLASYFIFKKNGQINSIINKYLKNLEQWLINWRMTIQSKKCNFMVFNKGSNSHLNDKLNLKLFNEQIPACKNFKFLGITFDIGLNFKDHLSQLKKKCNNRLNIVKILSNNEWKLQKIH